jgi:hypothetical protein
MRTAAADPQGKRLDRSVEIEVKRAKDCCKPAAGTKNTALTALRKAKSQNGTAQRLDQAENLRQLATTGVPLGECRINVCNGIKIICCYLRDGGNELVRWR